MGGSRSQTTVRSEYKERPLTEEEKDLLRAEAEFARLLGRAGMASEERSTDMYSRYLQTFAPLEDSMVARVLLTNQDLGKVDKGLLTKFQAAAKSSVESGAKGASIRLSDYFAKRGLEGSGLEAKALSQFSGQLSQATAQALQSAFFKALEQSDVYRQQKLQNVGSAIAVGKGIGQGAFGYQGLAGQQYGGASGAYGQTFRDWDLRWKQTSSTDSWAKQKVNPLASLGSIVNFNVGV